MGPCQQDGWTVARPRGRGSRGETGTARDLLESIASAYAAVTAEEAAFVAFASAEALVNPAIRGAVTFGTARMMVRMVELLRRRVETGELRGDADLEVAAMGFFGGFSFFFAQHRHLGPRAWRKRAAAFASEWAEQCFRGIASAVAPETRSPRRPR